MHSKTKTKPTLVLALRALVVTGLVVAGLMALRYWGVIGDQVDLTLGQVESLLGQSV